MRRALPPPGGPAAVAALELGVGWLPSVLVERTRSQRIRTIVDIVEPVELDGDAATALYWIAREAMLNVMKHPNARNVQIELKRDGKRWRMIIADGGDGFEGKSLSGREAEHFGMRMMADAAEMVGARLKVLAIPGEGTTATVTLADV